MTTVLSRKVANRVSCDAVSCPGTEARAVFVSVLPEVISCMLFVMGQQVLALISWNCLGGNCVRTVGRVPATHLPQHRDAEDDLQGVVGH